MRWMRRNIVILSTCAMGWTAGGTASLQPPANQKEPAKGPHGPVAEHVGKVIEQWTTIEAHDKLIRRELEEMKATPVDEPSWAKEWAGVYSRPNWRGIIALAPQSGLAYMDSDDASIHDGNYGRVAAIFEDGLEFSLAIDPTGWPLPGISPRVYFVRWGHQRYLVPKSLMLEFCDSYNKKMGYVSGYAAPMPYQRTEDESKPAEGLPNVPAEYAKFLLRAPLEARVDRVHVAEIRNGSATGTATLDIGASKGVYAGLCFRYADETGPQQLEVVTVEEQRCEVSFVSEARAIGDGKPPKVGQPVSTKRK